MKLKKCIMTNSTCYLECHSDNPPASEYPIKVTGIVVHSTGANNPNISRYVQPLQTDADYEQIIGDIGVNRYENDWNHVKRWAGVHAFIGKNKAGDVETYQVLPFDQCAWGVGKGTVGSYNFNPTARIQFEICEDGLTDQSYFNKAMLEAQEFCAYLCKMFGLNPKTQICSHYESYFEGYGCNHGDPHEWLGKFGKNMDWFRDCVKTIMEKDEKPQETIPAPAIPVQTLPSVDEKSVENSYAAYNESGKLLGTGADLFSMIKMYPGASAIKWNWILCYPNRYVAMNGGVPVLSNEDSLFFIDKKNTMGIVFNEVWKDGVLFSRKVIEGFDKNEPKIDVWERKKKAQSAMKKWRENNDQ